MKQTIKAAQIAVLLIAFGVFACSPKPATLVKYEKYGVSFTHLSDWKVTGEAVGDASAGVNTISVEGPHAAMVSIMIVPSSSEITLEEYAGGMEREREGAIKQVLSVGGMSPAKVTSTKSQDASAQVGGAHSKGIVQTFSIKLLGETVPHKATFFMVSDQDRKAFIQTQAATEDLTSVTPGFNATLASFRLNAQR